MDEQAKAAFLKYEDLKIEENRIKEALDKLKPILLENISVGQKIQGISGNFEMKRRSTWKFSIELETEEEKLKEKKQTEIATGAAKEVVTEYVEYRQAKNPLVMRENTRI